MMTLKGQVCGVVDKVSQKGTAYKLVKVLEMDGFARLTFVQDFRGVPVSEGQDIELEVAVRAYLTKNGKPEVAYTAWAAKEEKAGQPLAAVAGGRYK